MASIPSHAVVGLTLGLWFAPAEHRRPALLTGALVAALPDLDAIGHWLGVPTSSVFGHRGITHSLSVALVGGLVVAWLLTRSAGVREQRARLGLYLVLAMVSHGLIDACTNGGPGIAFFAPFSDARHFFPMRPIVVSPIGLHGVFGRRGLLILASEARWIGIPCALIAASALLARWRGTRGPGRQAAGY